MNGKWNVSAITLINQGAVLNNIGYAIRRTGSEAAAYSAWGIYTMQNVASSQIYNNVMHDIDNQASSNSGEAYGISCGSYAEIKNCIAADTTATSGTAGDFLASTQSYNLSSDATASGTGSLTNKAAADQFVSVVVGSEDLHLKSGADAIDAGTDLGTTPTGVNIDIDGRDRDAQGDTWDMGADEFVIVGGRQLINGTIHNPLLGRLAG